MKSKFSYILISFVMLGILLAPISPVIETRNDKTFAEIKLSEAVAQTNRGTTLWDEVGSCGIIIKGTLKGCLEQLFYFLFVSIPSFFMAITANIFNFMASLTLSDKMYRAEFIGKIWKVVRDFSNIFFIVILLYAAFQIILGLGHGGGKKIVASVILVALLVNFSLFLSKAVIDFSNILALIFYNKIDCRNENGDPCHYDPISNSGYTNVEEKNISGALVSRFNVNNFFGDEMLEKMREYKLVYSFWANLNPFGPPIFEVKGSIPTSTILAISFAYGIVIYSLAWTFFIVALSFLGRMLTLMMLMIVAPFAFVTASVPKFRGIDTIGFDSWIKKLFESAFSATIFMAILYLVSEILNAKVFDISKDPTNDGLTATLVLLFAPAILIVVLLKKGRDYVVKASGQITDTIFSGAKVLGGLALGGAALGAAGVAMAGRQTVGAVSKYVQNDSARRKDSFQNFGANIKSWSWGKKLNPLSYVKQAGKGVSSAIASGVHRIPTGGGKTLGQRMQDSEASFGKTQSSISKLDAKAVSEFGGKGKYDKDVKFKDLTGAEQLEVRKEIDKDQYARQKFGTSYDNIKEDSNKQFVNDAVNEAYKNYNAADKSTVAKEEVASKQIKTDIGITGDSSHEMVKYSTAEKAVGEFVSALRKGSYDVRNISEAPSLVKTPLNILGLGAALFGAPILGGGILGSVAGGLRGGLKKGSSEYGNVQKDFFKDLSEVIGGAITSSIKRANIKADVNIIDKKGHGSDSKGGGGHH